MLWLMGAMSKELSVTWGIKSGVIGLDRSDRGCSLRTWNPPSLAGLHTASSPVVRRSCRMEPGMIALIR
jgi:hypothetical protein